MPRRVDEVVVSVFNFFFYYLPCVPSFITYLRYFLLLIRYFIKTYDALSYILSVVRRSLEALWIFLRRGRGSGGEVGRAANGCEGCLFGVYKPVHFVHSFSAGRGRLITGGVGR